MRDNVCLLVLFIHPCWVVGSSGAGWGRGEVCWRLGWCDGGAQSPDQSCSSVHPPADLLTTSHRRAAPHHYIHSYTLVGGASSDGGGESE